MGKERFVLGTNEIGEIIVTDVETGNVYPYGTIYKFFGLIRLLNELSDENGQLKEENEKLQKENNDYEKQFRIINEKLDEYIKTADTYRIPISSLKYGDELGYFNGVYQYMKKLKKDIGVIGYE